MKSLNPLSRDPAPPSYLGSFSEYEALGTAVMIAGLAVVVSVKNRFADIALVQDVMEYLTVAGIISYAVILPAWFHKASCLRVQHSYGFWTGLRSALIEYRIACSFLPIVGFLFAPRRPEPDRLEDIE